MVTSTRLADAAALLPPPPALASLTGVNNNPPSPYIDGRPPQVCTCVCVCVVGGQAYNSALEPATAGRHGC